MRQEGPKIETFVFDVVPGDPVFLDGPLLHIARETHESVGMGKDWRGEALSFLRPHGQWPIADSAQNSERLSRLGVIDFADPILEKGPELGERQSSFTELFV